MSKSNVKYLHEVSQKTVKDGKISFHEEYIINGDKGLLIKHYHREGDDKQKFVAKEIDGKFSVRTMKNGTEETKEGVSKEDLIKMMKKDKMLDFAIEYLKNQQGGNDEHWGGKRRSKKRTSKRRTSRKTSRRTSRKGSKRTNKK